MKKFLMATLTVVLLFAVLGCNNDPDPKTNPKQKFYTVTFDKNNTDATGSTDPNPKTVNTKGIKAPDNTVTLPAAPTRTGYTFDGYNTKADGTGTAFDATTAVTANITVYAQWKKQGYKVTFNKNGGDTDSVPASIEVFEPDTTIGTLPATDPKREYYRFVEWNYNMDGSGQTVTANDTVDDSFSVYAQWEFVGGTPKVVGDTLVHNRPMMEIDEGVALDDDGSVTVTGGLFSYKFPISDATPPDWNLSDYIYFMIDYTLPKGEDGSTTGTNIRQYESTSTNYGSVSNASPWWSNNDIRNQRFLLTGAGTSGGITFQGNNPYTVRIESIIFYKLPKYTISFDIDGGAGTAPSPITDVVEGTTLGDRLPPDPTKSGSTFTGWLDGKTPIMATSPIMKTMTLKAGWATTAPAKIENIHVDGGQSGVPIYKFTMPGTKTWGDIKAITCTAMVPYYSYDIGGNGRVHVIGNYPLTTTFNATDAPGAFIGGLRVADWGGNRIVIHANNITIDAILNAAKGTTGTNYAGKWVTFTIELVDGGTNINSAWPTTPAEKPEANASGPFLLGVGITGSGAGLPGYFQKDVALVLTDDTKVKPDDFDEYFTGTEGAKLGQLFFTANGNNKVTRTVVYEPEEN
jgi:uncharacterized repeat protein (TIGR02543 family)